MGETKKGRMYMKQKKKSLFSLFLALMMVAGLMQVMTVETKAATNSVQAGPFTLSRDSGTIVEGVDYTFEKLSSGGSLYSPSSIISDVGSAFSSIAIVMSSVKMISEFLFPNPYFP